MKKFVLGLLAAGTALAAAAPATAAITISYSVNGGATTVLATDANTPGSANFSGNSGGYFFNVGATGMPITPSMYDLLTQSLNIQSSTGAAGTLNVFITESGLPTLNGGVLQSSFTSNRLQNATARISSLVNSTTLQSATFPSIGTFTGTNTVSANGPFSLTTRYDITFGAGAGTFNGTADITAVPEPATWGMMMLGFGAMGFALRRRRNVETRIRFA